MSGNRSGKGASTNTFETYRQIAPESLDDQTLRELIKTHNNNHAAISLAIENIWHDIPDQKAVGSEWVTASKSKKDVAPPKPAARRTEGGRGGAGRGRGGPAGGRGNGDGRGDRGGRGERGSKPSSHASPSRATPSPAAAAEDAPTEESVEEVEAPAEPVPAPAPAPVVAAPAVAAVATAPAGPVWGQGMSFAEKLKRAEAEKARLAALPKQEPAPAPATTATAETAPSTEAAAEGPKGRTRGPRRKGGAAAERKEGEAASAAAAAVAEIVAGAEALSVTGAAEKTETVTEAAAPAPEAVAPAAAAAVEAPAAPSVTEGFLKMGKWEAPVEAAEMTAFQFGSFGNAYESSPNNGVSASQVGTNPAAAPWTGLHSAEEKSGSTNVWGAPAEPSLDMSAGLFAQPAAASSGAADSSSAATRAPPGLGPKNNNNNKPSSVGQKPKVDAPQPAAAAAPAQVNNPYAQAYNQPPGMGRGLAAPYAYGGAFDVSQAQFGGYALPTAPVAPAVTTATSSATTTTTTATAQSSSTPAATPAANAQQQPGYPAPFNPYFNPYYGGQFYYGQQQLANFYGQGRDMYQQRGPYPYAGGASLYPDVYGQQVPGQFPDATGNYGMGMPVHPGMQGAAAASNAGNNASGANNNKGGKNANAANNAVGAATTQDQHAANLLMNPAYPYNPYAARGAMDGQGWGYPGTQAGWGNPMMGFPGNPSPTNLGGVGAGFQQQAGASQGQGNNQQGNQQGGRGNYGGRGGAGAAGASLPSGGVAAQGTW